MPGKDNLDFSFSGLKTHVRRYLTERGAPTTPDALADFCASFQKAVVDNLLDKAFRAAGATGRLVLAGGVAANSELRRQAEARGRAAGIEVHLPSRAFCTDNAAMIARAGWERLRRGQRSDWADDALARWDLFQLAS
jgi:N6-L-threonylcarbamoyladenine synthase